MRELTCRRATCAPTEGALYLSRVASTNPRQGRVAGRCESNPLEIGSPCFQAFPRYHSNHLELLSCSLRVCSQAVQIVVSSRSRESRRSPYRFVLRPYQPICQPATDSRVANFVHDFARLRGGATHLPVGKELCVGWPREISVASNAAMISCPRGVKCSSFR